MLLNVVDGDLNNLISYWKEQKEMVPENVVLFFFEQILRGLDFAHSKDVLHQDLKPDNVFVADKRTQVVKLGDFGIAKVLVSHAGVDQECDAGTLYFMPPEAFASSKRPSPLIGRRTPLLLSFC